MRSICVLFIKAQYLLEEIDICVTLETVYVYTHSNPVEFIIIKIRK